MKNSIIVFILGMIFLVLTSNAQAASVPFTVEQETGDVAIDTKNLPHEDKLKLFFTKHRSPLLNHIDTLLSEAEEHNLPWNLVAAISGVESTFCKRIPYQSYNCWGWNNGDFKFQDYDHAIMVISKALREKYYNRGLDTPEKISPVYAPPSKTWAGNVRFFMKEIENTSY